MTHVACLPVAHTMWLRIQICSLQQNVEHEIENLEVVSHDA